MICISIKELEDKGAFEVEEFKELILNCKQYEFPEIEEWED